MIKQFKTTGTVFLLLFFFQTYGQGPGYLGKHAFFRADLGSMVAFKGPTAGNKGYDVYGDATPGLSLNVFGNGMLGYTVSRRHALFADVGYYKTGMSLEASTPSIFDDYSTDYHYLFYNLTGKSIAVGCQWYNLKKGALAPLGNYFSWYLRRNWITGEILDKKTTYSSGLASEHGKLNIDPKTQFWSFGVEAGQHFIIYDRFLLNLSMVVNWPVGTILGTESSDESNQSKYNYKVKNRLFLHDLVQIKIGAGMLLF